MYTHAASGAILFPEKKEFPALSWSEGSDSSH